MEIKIDVCQFCNGTEFISAYQTAGGSLQSEERLLGGADLTKEYDKLSECTFDTDTKFPDKLPDNFDPKKILNGGKNETLGLGIKELHE